MTRGRISMAGTAGMQKLNSMGALFDCWAGSSDKILVRDINVQKEGGGGQRLFEQC